MIASSIGGRGGVGRIVSDGRIPLSHIQGLREDSKTAVGIKDCVEVTARSSMCALAVQSQKQCKSLSLANPHLGQRSGYYGLVDAILEAGQQAAHIIVSRAACSG